MLEKVAMATPLFVDPMLAPGFPSGNISQTPPIGLPVRLRLVLEQVCRFEPAFGLMVAVYKNVSLHCKPSVVINFHVPLKAVFEVDRFISSVEYVLLFGATQLYTIGP